MTNREMKRRAKSACGGNSRNSAVGGEAESGGLVIEQHASGIAQKGNRNNLHPSNGSSNGSPVVMRRCQTLSKHISFEISILS